MGTTTNRITTDTRDIALNACQRNCTRNCAICPTRSNAFESSHFAKGRIYLLLKRRSFLLIVPRVGAICGIFLILRVYTRQTNWVTQFRNKSSPNVSSTNNLLFNNNNNRTAHRNDFIFFPSLFWFLSFWIFFRCFSLHIHTQNRRCKCVYAMHGREPVYECVSSLRS